jgi:hydrogenase/urease accessory protein HupE
MFRAPHISSRREPSTAAGTATKRAASARLPLHRPELRRHSGLARALAVLAAFWLVWLGRSAEARAHSVGISRGDYALNGAAIAAAVTFSRSEIALALPELDEPGGLGPLSARGRSIVEKWSLAGLRFASDSGACPGQLSRADFSEGDGLTLFIHYTCAAPPRELSLYADFLSSVSSGHRHLVHVSFSGGAADYVIQRGATPLRIALPNALRGGAVAATEAGAWARFRDFFVLGLEHILTGYDHLAFLLGLLLVLGPVRSLVWAITAFTIAHSLTLSLASLGLATPSPSIIEPLIAASIVYVGIENWFVRDAVGRWRITFCFGLIHGFGFAGALREIALPRAELPIALFSFNLGVEAGQLAIVLLILPTLIYAHRRGWLSTARTKQLSLGVSALGLIWLVLRLKALL